MKNFLNLNIWVAAFAVLFFASCEDETTTDELQDVFESEYSELTAEDSKQDVEDAGIALVQNIDQLEDEEAIDVLMEMANLFGGSADAPAGTYNVPLKAASIIANDSKSSAEVFGLLKATTEQGLALSDSFAAQCATYAYDLTSGEFIKSENADAIVIQFPGKEGDLSNTAEITIGSFTVKEITSPREEFSMFTSIEVPTGLKATLKYEDSEIMAYTLTADYAADGTPTLLENVLKIGSFSFNQSLTHSINKSASFDYSFKNGSTILIAFGAEANGDWSSENIADNTYDVTETYTWENWDGSTSSYTDTWTQTDVEEIINNSNAYIQFMNLKAVGEVDIKAIVDAEQAFEKAHEADEDEWGDYPDEINKLETETLVDAVKENARFVLVYTADNTMIASLEPYTVEDPYSYTRDGVTYTENDYYLDFRMIFKDGSPVSMETFVEDELTGFFDALNDFITTINGNYNTTIEPIDLSDEEPVL